MLGLLNMEFKLVCKYHNTFGNKLIGEIDSPSNIKKGIITMFPIFGN